MQSTCRCDNTGKFENYQEATQKLYKSYSIKLIRLENKLKKKFKGRFFEFMYKSGYKLFIKLDRNLHMQLVR